MTTWTVRSRIIASSAAVATVIVALGIFSYIQMSSIRTRASFVSDEVMPAVFSVAQMRAASRDAMTRMFEEASAQTDEARQTAARATDRALASLVQLEDNYKKTIMPWEADERQLAETMMSARTRVNDTYQSLKADGVLTMAEVHTRLEPEFDTYARRVDALVVFNRDDGTSAASSILDSAATATQGIVLAMICGLLLVVLSAVGFLRAIHVPLDRLMDVTGRMRKGDFSQRVRVTWNDEFGQLGERINQMADELTGLIGQVQRSGIQVNSSVTEIAATAKQQQATATEIAATTSQVGVTARRISDTSKDLVGAMRDVAAVAERTATLASSSQGGLLRMETTMRQIMDASASINERLATLSEKAGRIGTVVTTIHKVADQTNLLSLNAAIEAEKAGEHGRGFAVLASEIRRLADQTAVATDDIEQIVKEMQSAVSSGVMGMDKFSEEVRRGAEAVGHVTSELSEIISQVKEFTPNLETVNDATQSQSLGAQEISEALAQLTISAQQTAESLRQSNTTIEQLNDAAHGLQSGVSRFTLAA
jgi:methyl-accepting chemotaxis protein WspA